MAHPLFITDMKEIYGPTCWDWAEYQIGPELTSITCAFAITVVWTKVV